MNSNIQRKGVARGLCSVFPSFSKYPLINMKLHQTKTSIFFSLYVNIRLIHSAGGLFQRDRIDPVSQLGSMGSCDLFGILHISGSNPTTGLGFNISEFRTIVIYIVWLESIEFLESIQNHVFAYRASTPR